MNIVLLFGSGISTPADYPCVGQITEGILSGMDSAEACQPSSAVGVGSGTGEVGSAGAVDVLAFLRWLRTVVEARYCDWNQRVANYEDIYFVASQIHDDLLDEFDNPALRPMIQRAIAEFVLLQGASCSDATEHLQGLAGRAVDCIRKQVVSRLGTLPKREKLRHLGFIGQSIQAAGIENITILTLNHDVLAETYLKERGVGFADGFSREVDDMGVRRWQPSSFRGSNGSVRLLKLHGGVDWYRLRPFGAQEWTEDYVGIIPGGSSSWYGDGQGGRHSTRKDAQGRTHSSLEEMLLIGTFNKLSRYTDPVYLEIYHLAFQAFERADGLVGAHLN